VTKCALKQTSFARDMIRAMVHVGMRDSYFQTERQCEECAEHFWGTEAARFCSKSCRQRAWRAGRPSLLRRGELADLCREVMHRAELQSGAASKLLPRLFRAVARELRSRGWDPIELLMSMPDEPASASDTAPGGIRGEPPTRRRWLYPPEVELEKLDALIAARLKRGDSVGWHLERREQIAEYLVVRTANTTAAKAT